MLHPDLYHSNIRFSDISETLDDYYTALYHELNNPKQPPELYTENKDVSKRDINQLTAFRSQKR